jgi:putative N-acetyltransferase (TIGR04045 family)
MIFEPFPNFLPSEYRVKFATEAWEHREAAALRRAVFCGEQQIFIGDDRDEIDDVAIPIVAISSFGIAAQEVVGTVRIYEKQPGIWWGSRLAGAVD